MEAVGGGLSALVARFTDWIQLGATWEPLTSCWAIGAVQVPRSVQPVRHGGAGVVLRWVCDLIGHLNRSRP